MLIHLVDKMSQLMQFIEKKIFRYLFKETKHNWDIPSKATVKDNLF